MKVIFHGDDFGLTSGVNQGIVRSFKYGLLSSTSLIASGEAAEEAIALARENPGLDVGIHLTLCDESPVLPSAKLSSLISQGSAFPSRTKTLTAILTRKVDYHQVESEWNAQIEKCLSAGIPISHMDSHQFMHLFPGLFPLCLRLADKYEISHIKTSNLDLMSFDAGFKRLLQLIVFKLYIKLFVSHRLSPHIGRVPSIGFLGAGGRMDCGSVLREINRIRRQQRFPVVEVILHPGIGDTHTRQKYKHWRYRWHKDLELLLDPSLAKALDRRDIGLTSYRELA